MSDPQPSLRIQEYQAKERALVSQNERLSRTLKEARNQLEALRASVAEMHRPPYSFGTVYAVIGADRADVFTAGRRMRLALSPDLEAERLSPGQIVVLDETLVIRELADDLGDGEVVSYRETLSDGRVVVSGRGHEESVVHMVAGLPELRAGDALRLEPRSGWVRERLERPEVADLVLEAIPDVDWGDIGGLGEQIDVVRDAVELPYRHPEVFAEHGLTPPKGILLYGPPGCGKTLIAKAVAASLSRAALERTGGTERGYFLNIKGPELLNKYVGETERHIRLIFSRAREKAGAGAPVVVFFDEMESLFRTRGSGVSSDVETTIVPQLLAEIDGVEGLENVLVIGASNREDLIDPAILRPGRLDVKVKVDRPHAAEAAEILSKYLTPSVPLHPSEIAAHGTGEQAIESLISHTVESVYALTAPNRFLEVTYASGEREILYMKDFASGAMLANIVDRAKKLAIKDLLTSGERGLTRAHLTRACRDEFRENEDLPNTTNPDDWARISGRKGERIVFIRTLMDDGPGRALGD